jgi:hypothetical protein
VTKESGLLGLYWPARQDRLEDCGRWAYETLRVLQTLGYTHYYFLGRSRRDALKRELEVTEKNVLATLAKGVSRADIPRAPIPELGWTMSLWSGDSDGESYSISMRCGGYSEHVGNSVVLKLPPSGTFSISTSPDRAMKAYEALLRIWQPEQAVLCEGSIDWQGNRLVPTRKPLAQHPQRSA